jgi:4-diphosphocytidyl-2-C-methyl-D-erythritol kinase
VPLHDRIEIARQGNSVQLSCDDPHLPVDGKNLVFRAAELFLRAAGISEGVRIHLEKRIPMAAGLGGGSGNAATTLLGLNELFGTPLENHQLHELAASLGSDVPFFLQHGPALASGRGEKVQSLAPFPALRGVWIILVHPGFGISTPWAYTQLRNFPEALNGRPGRAQELVDLLTRCDLATAASGFYNSLEAPAFKKYPLLVLFQQFFRKHGAVSLMSGSGSTTFALIKEESAARTLVSSFRQHFGEQSWITTVALS